MTNKWTQNCEIDQTNLPTLTQIVFNNQFKSMRIVILVIISIFILNGNNTLAFQSNSKDDGKLISQEVYQFPNYQTAVEKTDVEKYTTREEYEKAVADKKFEFSKITYLSDGLKVKAFLYKPKKLNAKLPVIVFNRGSFVRGDIAPELIVFFRRLASEGFVVVAPMYRQSDGGEGRDEMGGGDLNDLMNVVLLIKSFDFADTNNLFLYGESRGGIMTYLALRRKFPANAAAVFGATSDLESYLNDNAKAFTPKVLNQIWTDYEQNKEKILNDRSAIKWTEEITTPLLIMHGGSDLSVNPLQSLTFAEKLQGLRKAYQLKIFAGDNHTLAKSQVERDRETVSWFRSFLK